MGIAVVLVFVLTFSWLSGQGASGAPMVTEGPSLVGDLKRATGEASAIGRWFDGLKNVLPSKAPVRLRDDFRGGLESWTGAPLSAAVVRDVRDFGWSWNNGVARPGRLRLWTPSIGLADYKLEFEGVIEKRAVSWTYRASDLNNYYANKLILKRPAPQPAFEIVRYSMVAGHQVNSVRLPLPLGLTNQSVYHLETRVKGDQFTTLLNGQVVDTWSDKRFTKGGVGFFSEPGEQAAIHWVNVSEEREGFLGRIFSLAFFVNPSLQMVALQ